jgi:high-affinity K+ transport system ATPase subunit B
VVDATHCYFATDKHAKQFSLPQLFTPLALRGVKFRPLGAARILQRNLLIYGVGGVIIPFIGIKAIDLVVAALHLA